MSTIKTNTIQPTQAGNNLVFANGTAVEAMRITDAGNVGVGTVAPSALLEISGTPVYQTPANWGSATTHTSVPHLLLRSDTVNTIPEIQFMERTNKSWVLGGDPAGTGSGANGTFCIRDDFQSGNSVRLAITNIGNVGIGTVAPNAKLEIFPRANNTEAVIVNASTSGDVGLRLYEDNGTPDWFRFRPSATVGSRQKGFLFSNAGDTGILAVDTINLRVGIGGNTTPAVALDVAGQARSSTGTTAGSAATTLTTKDYVDTSIGSVVIGRVPVISTVSEAPTTIHSSGVFTFKRVSTTASNTVQIKSSYGTWFVYVNSGFATDVSFDDPTRQLWAAGVGTSYATTYAIETVASSAFWTGAPGFIAVRTA